MITIYLIEQLSIQTRKHAATEVCRDGPTDRCIEHVEDHQFAPLSATGKIAYTNIRLQTNIHDMFSAGGHHSLRTLCHWNKVFIGYATTLALLSNISRGSSITPGSTHGHKIITFNDTVAPQIPCITLHKNNCQRRVVTSQLLTVVEIKGSRHIFAP